MPGLARAVVRDTAWLCLLLLIPAASAQAQTVARAAFASGFASREPTDTLASRLTPDTGISGQVRQRLVFGTAY